MQTSPSKSTTRVLALSVLIAAPAEGLRRYAYQDPVGILTVCYGHTGSVQQGREYSMGECMRLLTADMQEALEIVTKAHPEAPERVLVAFSDAVFNIGPKIAVDSQASTAARFLYAKQWDAACEQLPRWNKANVAGMLVPLPGLTARRQKELEFCKGAQA